MAMPMVGRRIWSSARAMGKKGSNFRSQCSSYNTVVPTCVRYPDINSQKKDFAKLNADDINTFRNILDPGRVLTEDLDMYNIDWLRSVRGLSECVLKPRTTAEVSAVVQHCYKRGLPICPQGGNTGMVGGSVPIFDEIVLSTELMSNIEELDENSGIVTLQAGVILEKLDNYLSNYGLMAPLDLGAKGSCRLGGNVSTNAGGLRLLRYGSLHANVLGVEVVLAQEGGPVLDCLRVALKKDNTGYDLKHLFIGSEGTLGIVTKIALFCPPRPTSVKVAFLQINTFQEVLEVFRTAKRSLGEIISSFEFIDCEAMKCVTENLGLSCPLGISENSFYVLIETSGSHSAHDDEKLNAFLENSLNSGLVANGIMASEPSKILQLWALRERITEALMRDGYCYKYDISLPLKVFYDIILEMRQKLGSRATRCIGYGHLGDGNLHLNITSRDYDVDLYHSIEPFIYEWTHKNKGSISAEHGIGFKKRDHLHFSKPDNAIRLMHQLKNVFDPKGILNPYKVLPS